MTLTGSPAAPASAGPDWQRNDCTPTGSDCTIQVNADTVVPVVDRATVTRQGQRTHHHGRRLAARWTQCTENVPVGSSLQLIANPAAGSSFQAWRGGGCSTSPVLTVSSFGDTALTAIHARSPALTVSVSGAANGTVVVTRRDFMLDCWCKARSAPHQVTANSARRRVAVRGAAAAPARAPAACRCRLRRHLLGQRRVLRRPLLTHPVGTLTCPLTGGVASLSWRVAREGGSGHAAPDAVPQWLPLVLSGHGACCCDRRDAGQRWEPSTCTWPAPSLRL